MTVTAPYTTAANIAALLGVTLTSAQQSEATATAAAATVTIDRLTHRSWQQDGTITGELVAVEGPIIYLKHRPVAAILSMTAQGISIADQVLTLTDGQDYRLLDGPNGVVTMQNWWDLWMFSNRDVTRDMAGSHLGKLLTVSYTTTETVPEDIARAATLMAAQSLQPTLMPGLFGFKSVNVAGTLAVTVDDGAGYQAEIDRILSAHTRPVFA